MRSTHLNRCLVVLAVGCGLLGIPRSSAWAAITPEDFSTRIDNRYYPLIPGTVYIYEGTREGCSVRDEFEVTFETKVVMGVPCRVVRDRTYVDEVLEEDTLDWYAQDKDGNVWFFGEDTKELNKKGMVISTAGSWEAGVNNAQPGIVMQAQPRVNDTYQQEYAAGVAEDKATVLALDANTAVPFGTFANCVKTKDFSPLDPNVVEQKYFAPGVGCILSVTVKGGAERLDLVHSRGRIVISEVLAHSHHTASDWIELYNTTDQPVGIGGWFLSDVRKDLTKYRIADATVVPARGYVVFYEDVQFGYPGDPGCRVPFALSEAGDPVYLTSGYNGQPTGYSEHESFAASESGVSFGRFITSDGVSHFVSLSQSTPGQANAYPRVGPVVINEIMYNPPDARGAEYVELQNIGDQEVKLYDAATQLSWRFIDGPAKGRTKLIFSGTSDVTIGPGQVMLLVKNLAVFNATYSVPDGTKVFEWPDGRLDPSAAKLELAKAIDIDGIDTGWVHVEEINYSDGSHPLGQDPWPKDANGTGFSLSRIHANRFGDDPANWKAGSPSPGRVNP